MSNLAPFVAASIWDKVVHELKEEAEKLRTENGHRHRSHGPSPLLDQEDRLPMPKVVARYGDTNSDWTAALDPG